jgi:hypothetical protein
MQDAAAREPALRFLHRHPEQRGRRWHHEHHVGGSEGTATSPEPDHAAGTGTTPGGTSADRACTGACARARACTAGAW